jgi:hypothetical protein
MSSRDARETGGVSLAALYEVTPDGRVFSLTNWRGLGRRELAQEPNDDGYPSVRLIINGKRTRKAVHVLVAERYLPPRPTPAHEVRHLDGNKLNRSADNLAWGTRAENAADREAHGRTSRGERHAAAVRKGLAKSPGSAPRGGHARAAALSPERRSDISRNAINARWAKSECSR